MCFQKLLLMIKQSLSLHNTDYKIMTVHNDFKKQRAMIHKFGHIIYNCTLFSKLNRYNIKYYYTHEDVFKSNIKFLCIMCNRINS